MKSQKILHELQQYEAELASLREKESEFNGKKKKLLLEKKNVRQIDDRLNEFQQRMSDIETILLPELKERYEKAQDVEAQQQKQNRVAEIADLFIKDVRKQHEAFVDLVAARTKVKNSIHDLHQLASHLTTLERELRHLGSSPSRVAPKAASTKLVLPIPMAIRTFANSGTVDSFLRRNMERIKKK